MSSAAFGSTVGHDRGKAERITDIGVRSTALKQLVRGSECHLHERLVVSNVDDGRSVHSHIKVVNLEASKGALWMATSPKSLESISAWMITAFEPRAILCVATFSAAVLFPTYVIVTPSAPFFAKYTALAAPTLSRATGNHGVLGCKRMRELQ